MAGEHPAGEDGEPIVGREDADEFLGLRGWSFDYGENPEYIEQGLPCAYAHCIRNRPPLSPETAEGCPVFGYACPGSGEQVAWCREHPPLLD